MGEWEKSRELHAIGEDYGRLNTPVVHCLLNGTLFSILQCIILTSALVHYQGYRVPFGMLGECIGM